jgi:nucleoid-associated protein YgaU
MSLSRYEFSTRIKGGKYYGSSDVSSRIFTGVENGTIDHVTVTITEGQRLDHLAGKVYKDSSLWWVIAAASGIGWGLQVPPGKIIKIPTNLDRVYSVL